MTKLLLPVKTWGLETPHGEIDTCQTRTNTPVLCVHGEYLLLAGGGFNVGDQSPALTEASVFSPRSNQRLCHCASPHLPSIPMCFTLPRPPLHQLILLSLLK